jgi:hypothetical protein
MYELVYCSTARQTLRREEILSLLKKAREFNSAHDITGCLLYYNQQFIQILEGEKEILKSLYDKIHLDNRHTQVTILSEGQKDERVFDDWTMAFYELSENDVQGLSREVFVDNLLTFSQIADKPTFPMILFWSTVRQLLTN